MSTPKLGSSTREEFIAYYKEHKQSSTMPTVLTPLANLILPFSNCLVWEDAKSIQGEEEYYDFMMNVWFYYLSHIDCHKVIESCIILGEDSDNFLFKEVESSGVDLVKDNWGIAYTKLSKHIGFDLMDYWLNWPMPCNEKGFTYAVYSEGLDTCLSLVIYLYEHLVSSKKKITIPGIKFESLQLITSGVLGKSDKPWVK